MLCISDTISLSMLMLNSVKNRAAGEASTNSGHVVRKQQHDCNNGKIHLRSVFSTTLQGSTALHG
jgi:hypothetical protein